MARVPSYDSPQVSPGGAVPQGRIQTPEILDAPGQQLQAFGGAVQKFGGSVGRIAAEMQAEADEVRITDALNRVKEQALTLQHDKDVGYLSVKGRDAFERADGKPLESVYGEQLGNTISDLAGGLANDRQRAAFAKAAGSIAVNFRGGVQEHERREYIGYQASVSEGVISTAQRDIALNWGNPDAVQAAIQRTQGEVYRQAKLMGKSAEWQEATSRKLTSDAHKLAALSALENGDVDFADAYLRKHSEGMEADDLFQVRKQVDEFASVRLGTAKADAIFAAGADGAQRASQAASPGGSFDRMVQITLHSESRGRRYGPDGKTLLTSPAGAKGEMQVMPDTMTAPGFGIKPADPSNPDDVARVGREYLGKMLQRYGGDPAKAWAAYNWGPGAVDNAVKTKGADWLASAPKETQNYVAQNLRMLGGGGGASKPARFDTLAALSALESDPALARNPKAMQAARQQLEHKARLYDARTKDQADQVFSGVLQGLIQNGGDFNALPAGQKMALAQVDPAKYDDAMRFADGLSKGKQPQTDWGLFYELSSDPATLRGVNLMAVRDKLADTEFKQLMTMQQSAGKEQSLTALQTPMALVTQFAREAGIKTNGADKKDAEKLGRITADVQANITAAEQARGKKLTADDMRAVVAQSFVKVQVDRPYWFNTEKPAALLDPADRLVIPDAERTQIVDALKRNGKPTDENTIQALYRRHKGL